MTGKQKQNKRNDVIARFREQLANLQTVEVEVVAPFTRRIERMVELRKSTHPPPMGLIEIIEGID